MFHSAAHLPHLWLPYSQMKTAPYPVEATRTEGSTITLRDGRQLIDGIASWWTACHGYNHPHLRCAITEQTQRMPHIMLGGMVHEPALTLASRLSTLLPGDLDRVFFTDSGSVAMEVACKIAVQFHLNRGTPNRHKLLSFRGGYHGDTLGMMAICDPEEGMHSLFGDALPRQVLADLPTTPEHLAELEQLLEKRGHEIAAMITEPLVQGAGGMVFHTPQTLRHLRRLCDQHGILLIIDEVFTGFGRTGRLFASEEAGIVPDIVALSKALTGGTLPLAATIARTSVFEAFLSDNPLHALMHGPTFMANPLACAVANASLDLFEQEPRLEQVHAIAQQLEQELAPCRNLPGVRDVRVKGAIGVIELDQLDDAPALNRAFLDEAVWIRPFRRIIYLTPAFTITPDELSRLTGAIYRVLKARS
ncbi:MULTISPECIES: adenosylmethionine--8-amino-7-oxononanoate transaminase [unclassified Saccharibacter]|uniref:adenosylmethionine--8-amino-7-oxononanoate transaminase n=1 Tax=unclassified Saccharibacter TaxID=2648722 RepID=UPI0013288CE5|nr:MULTISPECIES: adenosylmethionine--8-amino-7-oxononanoate transaminase [unclassified Saccharibacter]MXV36772.1 adenosylmethionine--8-amino-7-oxononanoate transaminase [Saccharibacter sp. EH611]MXV58264.1 adenosylmethionine--8-amino-7-oxononanoate transaminase [Saccharibacter sp. EH70]MXV65720.1 adenosylmethionine--8-amino-7-oxononanoate transaminase [Saccharibacter sp. EH60]